MAEVKTISAPAIDLVDESFDPEKSNTYHLSILLSENNLCYSILDANTNKYVVLHFTPTLNGEDALAPLQGLGVTNFKSVTCAVAHPKFTLVPSALFDDASKESLLAFNHPVESGEKIHSDTLRNVDAKNLFTIPRDLEKQVREYFPNAHFLHNSTAFIEALLTLNKNNKGKKVFADFHSSYFEIVILDGRELLFSNAFQYKTPEDIAYYILFVYEQLHLSPEETELVLSGSIEKAAPEHSLLYNYIRNVKFASLPESFKYSYKFDEIQLHHFFSLFNQYLCA